MNKFFFLLFIIIVIIILLNLHKKIERFKDNSNYKKIALTTCNNNYEYYKWIPYCINFWKKIDFDIVIYFFDKKLPIYLKKYSKYIILWEPPKNLYIPSVCQISRLFLPALHTNYDMVLITDVDLLPLSKSYFSMINNFSKKKFIAMRKKQNEFYIGFNVASPNMWFKLTGTRGTKQDIYNKLFEIFNQNKINNKYPIKVSWGLDQKLLKKYIDNLKNKEKIIITNLENYYILHSNWEYKKAYFQDKNKKINKKKIKDMKNNFIFFTRDNDRKTTNLKKEINFLDVLYSNNQNIDLKIKKKTV